MIKESFLLQTKTAKKLYSFVKDLPIIDYHCHLSPKMIAEDYRFEDAYDLFLGGDHYKWRQMRSFGIEENFITGDEDRYEKWLGFARVMPYLIGNPLYHWTTLELKRYFGIDTPLCEETAKEIWEKCNALLKEAGYSAKGLIARSNVEIICTTDDPADTLEYHKKIRESGFSAKVFPTFRPDKAVNIEKAEFCDYIKAQKITSFENLIEWLTARVEFFHENGCRISDHALEYVPFAIGKAEAVFEKKMKGEALSHHEIDSFKTAVLSALAKEYTRLGWAMQFHIGALRNNNSKMFASLGADTGFDSVNDLCIAEKLSACADTDSMTSAASAAIHRRAIPLKFIAILFLHVLLL